jgi:Sulfotransferase family
VALLREGRHADAESFFRDAIQIDPLFATPWARLAQIHAERGDIALSCESASSARALAPNLAEAHWRLATTLKRRMPDAEVRAIEKLLADASYPDGARLVACWLSRYGFLWSRQWEHIARRFAVYQQIVAHWRRTKPIEWLEVPYEGLVGDVEVHARRLIEFVGVAWDPACVQFHTTRRVVRTPSLTVVRQPIYSKSVGRWRNYETSLQPLFRAFTILSTVSSLAPPGYGLANFTTAVIRIRRFCWLLRWAQRVVFHAVRD